MNLQFVKQDDGNYVATTTVSKDFNLHVECNFNCAIVVKQKTSGNNYAVSKVLREGSVVDVDFSALVYPKQIRIDCIRTLEDKQTSGEISGIITEA